MSERWRSLTETHCYTMLLLFRIVRRNIEPSAKSYPSRLYFKIRRVQTLLDAEMGSPTEQSDITGNARLIFSAAPSNHLVEVTLLIDEQRENTLKSSGNILFRGIHPR